jgi:hypothetical protein
MRIASGCGPAVAGRPHDPRLVVRRPLRWVGEAHRSHSPARSRHSSMPSRQTIRRPDGSAWSPPTAPRPSCTIEPMSVPGRVEAASLLISLDPHVRALRHARAVAEVAAWIAARAIARGRLIDRRRLEAAALLHDVDKLLPAHHPLKGLPHGEGSATWLADAGYPELSPLVIDHPVTRLADESILNRLLDGPPEALIVAYADKRAAQRLGSIDVRFASWRRRYPRSSVETLRARAGRLESAACALAGVRPDEVRRLRWTSAALREARKRSA